MKEKVPVQDVDIYGLGLDSEHPVKMRVQTLQATIASLTKILDEYDVFVESEEVQYLDEGTMLTLRKNIARILKNTQMRLNAVLKRNIPEAHTPKKLIQYQAIRNIFGRFREADPKKIVVYCPMVAIRYVDSRLQYEDCLKCNYDDKQYWCTFPKPKEGDQMEEPFTRKPPKSWEKKMRRDDEDVPSGEV